MVKQCTQTKSTLADTIHTLLALTSSMATELLKFRLFRFLVPFCFFGLRVARVVWARGGVLSPQGAKSEKSPIPLAKHVSVVP